MDEKSCSRGGDFISDSKSTRALHNAKRCNLSRVAQEDLINSGIHKDYDILALQEPYIDVFGNTKATRNWRVLYPTSHLSDPMPLRAVMLVSSEIGRAHV